MMCLAPHKMKLLSEAKKDENKDVFNNLSFDEKRKS
jgi:hypothetical protein